VSLEETIGAIANGKVEHVTPEYVDTKVSELNLTDVRNAIRARTVLRNNHMLGQYSATVNIRSPHPVLVVAFGDQHYGSGDTDHDRIDRDVGYILDTPGVYTFLMGNIIDNAIPSQFPDGMLQNVIPPEEQVIAMRKIIQELDAAGKILGTVEAPCHEGWTWKKAGQDINRLMFGYEGRKFPVMENGGKLTIVVNEIPYRFAMYHQTGPFNSNLNKNNGTKRMRELQHSNADVVAAAHHHVSEAMQTYADKGEDMRPVVYLRTGCYKLDDKWAGGKGFIKGEPGGQSVQLWHNEKRMQPSLDIETALQTHTALALYHRVIRSLEGDAK